MINNEEIKSMVNQTAEVRFDYTISRIADFGTVWVIEDKEGFIVLADDDENLIFPIWPFEEYAKLFCVGEYSSCTVSSIEIHEFLDNYIPEFEKANYKLSLFPLNTGKGMAIDIGEFLSAIQEKLDEIE